jgi:hypothetical protein
MHIHCHGNPFTKQLPSDNLGIVDVFTGRYEAMGAVHRVTPQQQVYVPQYLFVYHLMMLALVQTK